MGPTILAPLLAIGGVAASFVLALSSWRLLSFWIPERATPDQIFAANDALGQPRPVAP